MSEVSEVSEGVEEWEVQSCLQQRMQAYGCVKWQNGRRLGRCFGRLDTHQQAAKEYETLVLRECLLP